MVVAATRSSLEKAELSINAPLGTPRRSDCGPTEEAFSVPRECQFIAASAVKRCSQPRELVGLLRENLIAQCAEGSSTSQALTRVPPSCLYYLNAMSIQGELHAPVQPQLALTADATPSCSRVASPPLHHVAAGLRSD